MEEEDHADQAGQAIMEENQADQAGQAIVEENQAAPEPVHFHPNIPVLFCRICQTTLAKAKYITGRYDDVQDRSVEVAQMVNIVISDTLIGLRVYTAEDNVKAQLSCMRCSQFLGYIFVSTTRRIIYTNNVLLRHGREIRNAITQAFIANDWRLSSRVFNTLVPARIYKCRDCRVHLARESDDTPPGIGMFDRQNVYNIYQGTYVNPEYDTAAHAHCTHCFRNLGYCAGDDQGSVWFYMDMDATIRD